MMNFENKTRIRGNHDYYEYISAGIRKLRRNLEMTQTKFAQVLKCSVTHLSHIETGQQKPSLDILLVLCREFGMSLDVLAGHPGIRDPHLLRINQLLTSRREEDLAYMEKLLLLTVHHLDEVERISRYHHKKDEERKKDSPKTVPYLKDQYYYDGDSEFPEAEAAEEVRLMTDSGWQLLPEASETSSSRRPKDR